VIKDIIFDVDLDKVLHESLHFFECPVWAS
jgi:hypothetical protein